IGLPGSPMGSDAGPISRLIRRRRVPGRRYHHLSNSTQGKKAIMDPLFIVSLMLLGAFGGFAAGLLGIGGGMILVPFMIMLFPMVELPEAYMVHTAIATSMGTIMFTSISSMRAHHRKRAIRWDIVAVLAPGIVIGGLLSGGAVFSYIDPAWLSLVFASFVAYSAGRMMW